MLSYKSNSKTLSILKTLFDYSLHLIFPVNCPVCSKPAVIICDKPCLENLFNKNHVESKILSEEKENIEFKVYFTEKYGGDIKNVIVRMKYDGCKTLCKLLGNGAAKVFTEKFERPDIDLLIPVPLHSDSTRYFNQSFEIAKAMGNFWGIEVKEAAKWSSGVSHQVGKNAKEREKMPNDAFIIIKKYIPDLKNLNIALVDDVCTTGTTLKKLALAFKKQGVNVKCAYTICAVKNSV